jgi:shikimate dehydrogenase
MIAQTADKSIPAIFAEDGENAFRRLEHDAVCLAGKNGGGIIVTGGGVVTREENYEPLHQNGRIYRVERDVAALATDGRPLSKDIDTVKAMYEARKPMYDRFADVTVDNNGTAEAAAKAIWRDFNENSHY